MIKHQVDNFLSSARFSMAKGFYPFQQHSDSEHSSPSETNNNNSSRDMNSRRAFMNLPLSQMAIPIYTANSREDVEVGGRVLFHNFLHEELEHEGLSGDVLEFQSPLPGPAGDVSPQSSVYINQVASPSVASTPQGYINAELSQVGTRIRELATEFASSRERSQVRQHADQVDLAHINQESFFNMLSEVFRNGMDRHCIVALFFFCSDILIRCAKQELRDMGTKLFLWSMEFFVNRVCEWVYEHGGWEKVFSNIYIVVRNVFSLVALGVVITCGIIWMRKNL